MGAYQFPKPSLAFWVAEARVLGGSIIFGSFIMELAVPVLRDTHHLLGQAGVEGQTALQHIFSFGIFVHIGSTGFYLPLCFALNNTW